MTNGIDTLIRDLENVISSSLGVKLRELLEAMHRDRKNTAFVSTPTEISKTIIDVVNARIRVHGIFIDLRRDAIVRIS